MRIIDNSQTQAEPKLLENPANKEILNEEGNKSKKFDDSTIELILTTLAFNGGKEKQTAEQVREQFAIEIHPTTLARWKNSAYASQYSAIQRNLADKLSSQLAGKITDVAHQSITIQERLQGEMEEQLNNDSFDLKDLPSAIRNMAQASEISIRQKQILEDKPTEIIEVRGIEETISDLEESELIIDAETVEDEDESNNDNSSSIALPI